MIRKRSNRLKPWLMISPLQALMLARWLGEFEQTALLNAHHETVIDTTHRLSLPDDRTESPSNYHSALETPKAKDAPCSLAA